ncbi:hypothetical protein SAMN05443428_12822 [Caloramator quimbayensis]|uniref:Uncharacterized protein n=1 Tax=Caloramator quimbayensis TaxID=1147123 RepID=A0A1T4Y986_9CLOT|nr:hypothetical protein [Caloramator quimbayensis]SKA98316.1 hypothetical protein SAMN05443428_12822 [Caloramator quimbayensis]
MEDILLFILNKLHRLDKTCRIQDIAGSFIIEKLLINYDSIDYSSKLNLIENKMLSIIKRENAKFVNDGFEEPFIIKGSSNNLISKSESFNILYNSFFKNNENCNEFSNRIGRDILRLMGCKEENIFITPNSYDEGIDYWGFIKLENIV